MRPRTCPAISAKYMRSPLLTILRLKLLQHMRRLSPFRMNPDLELRFSQIRRFFIWLKSTLSISIRDLTAGATISSRPRKSNSLSAGVQLAAREMKLSTLTTTLMISECSSLSSTMTLTRATSSMKSSEARTTKYRNSSHPESVRLFSPTE